MTDGVTVALDVTVFARGALSARAARKPFAEQRPHRFERGLVLRQQIELGAVTRGEQDAAARACCHHALERGGNLVRAMRKALAHIERRGPMVHAQDLDAHADVSGHRNRPTPGSTSFSAT